MHSFSADRPIPIIRRDSSGADQLCRRILRYAGTAACLSDDAGLARHRAASRFGSNCRRHHHGARRQGGWSLADRSAPGLCRQPASICTTKQRLTRYSRHPAGGRKDVFRWSGADGRPVAELEIYRPGDEVNQVGSAPDIAAGWTRRPARARSGRRRRQQVRPGDAASPAGGAEAAVPALASSSISMNRNSDLRLVLPGRRLAGPARRDRLHAQPADPADRRKRPETGGIVRPRRTQAQRLRGSAPPALRRIG